MAITNLGISSTGNWTTGKKYIVGDIALVNGYEIVCLVAHTAGTYVTDVQSRYWQMSTACKNYVINGDFKVNQRSTANDAIDARYTRDRWYCQTGIGGATNTFTQQASGMVGTNSEFCMRITKTDTGTGTGTTYAFQGIETQNCRPLIGKTVTLSCKARTNSPSNIRLFLQGTYATGADAAPSSGLNISTQFFNLTTAFQLFTITFVVPANALSIQAIAAQNVNVAVNNQNNYIEITDVILNEGPAPAQFQLFSEGSAQTELAVCQRYYEVITAGQGALGFNQTAGAATTALYNAWKVTKRTNPTVTVGTGAVQQSGIDGLTTFQNGTGSGAYYSHGGISGSSEL